MVPRDILQSIRVRMMEQGWSQERLAKYLGISQPRLSERLTGECDFTRDELESIAIALRMQDELSPFCGIAKAGNVREKRLLRETISEALDTLSLADAREVGHVVAILLEAKLPPNQRRLAVVLRGLTAPQQYTAVPA